MAQHSGPWICPWSLGSTCPLPVPRVTEVEKQAPPPRQGSPPRLLVNLFLRKQCSPLRGKSGGWGRKWLSEDSLSLQCPCCLLILLPASSLVHVPVSSSPGHASCNSANGFNLLPILRGTHILCCSLVAAHTL